MKKVLSLVLVIAMVLSSFSFAFAANFEDVEGDYEDAINTLVGLGVVTGYEDGTYRPERIVTRAEMAKLIVEILGYGNLVAGSKSNFADTQGHWADPWIALAAGRGLVIGTGDGNFTPDRQVSYDEAITMVVRALGYTDDSNEIKNMSWPTNFKIKATELDLLDGVKLGTGGADRGGVAQLLYNALEAELVTITSEGDVKESGKILLSRLASEEDLTVDPDHVDKDSKKYKGDIVDLVPYMYQTLVVYENKDGDVVYVKESNSLVIAAEVKDLDGDVLHVEYNDKDYEFDVVTGTAIFFNGEEADDLDSVVEGLKLTVVLDAEDDDKVVNNLDVVGLIARKATVTGMMADIYDDETVVLEVEDMDCPLPLVDVDDEDDGVDFDKLTVTGDAESLEEIEEDDVVALYYGKNEEDAANKLEIVVTRDIVEGKITRVNRDGDVTIGGKVYEDGGYDSGIAEGVLKAGSKVTLFLDQDGDIYFAELTEDAALDDYALVLDTKTGFETSGGVRLAEPKVKLLTATGEVVTYVLDDEEDSVGAFVYTGAEDEDETTEPEDLIVDLNEGDLIKFSLNKDDEVDDIERVKTYEELGEGADNIKTSGNSFNIASNAVIFNVPNGADDTEDAAVVDIDDLSDVVLAYAYRPDDGKIEVLLVYEELVESDTVYAVLAREAEEVVDPDDEDEVVFEYTFFVDGKEVVYLGEVDEDTPVVTVTGLVVELVLENGRLVNFDNVNTDHEDDIDVTDVLEAQDERVTTSIKVEDGDPVYLTNDVIIYVYDEEDNEVTIGNKSDIRDNLFKAYNFEYDVTDDFGVVVVNPQLPL